MWDICAFLCRFGLLAVDLMASRLAAGTLRQIPGPAKASSKSICGCSILGTSVKPSRDQVWLLQNFVLFVQARTSMILDQLVLLVANTPAMPPQPWTQRSPKSKHEEQKARVKAPRRTITFSRKDVQRSARIM